MQILHLIRAYRLQLIKDVKAIKSRLISRPGRPGKTRVRLVRGAELRTLANQLNCANQFARQAQEKGTETAAQQWLVGNSILLQRTLQRLKAAHAKHRSLPALENEARVIVMARGWIDTLDGRLCEEKLVELCERQRRYDPLTVAELDALGDALALALFEQIVIAACIGNTKEKRAKRGEAGLGDVAFAEQGYLQRQAQLDYHMAALVQNLQALEDLDVERICAAGCPANVLLREDAVFMAMDRASRATYRLAVADKARLAGRSEEEVVRAALQLAADGKEPYAKEVGYYLLDDGQGALFSALNANRRGRTVTRRQKERRAVAGICALTAAAVVPLFFLLPPLHALWIALLTLPLSQQMAQEIVRRIALRVGDHVLCALDFSEEIPADCATAVVVPVLLTSPARARAVARSLEALYLGNRSDRLCFILLGDYKDSKKKAEDTDAAIAREATLCIRELNARYGLRFFYLQRPRRHHKPDNVYMGRERKRGALCDLARLLLHGETGPFEDVEDALMQKSFRYMLTLDADTQMQPGGAHKLIGAIGHPLNRAHMDREGRVFRGYGIMHPIVRITLRSAARTFFSRSFSSQAGIDAYAGISADAWFKLLGRGVFTGKGLIDLEVFERAACAVLPGGAILSHDLLEGALCGAALCDRVQVLDGCPPNYLSWAKREHRWMRGDWQLLPFIASSLPIAAIDRLRMTDNLLRSLRPVALLALLFAAALLDSAGLVLYSLLLWSSPFWIMLCTEVYGLFYRENRGARVRTIVKSSIEWLTCLAFEFLMLGHRAFLAAHATACALYRRYISGRRLLEWVTAADAEEALSNAVYSYLLRLWYGPLAAVFLCLARLEWWPVAALWAVSPFVAWAVSREISAGQPLSRDQRLRLGALSRRTWEYFVCLVNERTHYLPPDNYQFAPKPGPALRTSPTNIGYALLADVCAAQLSYIGWDEMCARIGDTLNTLEGMESYRGHFYNWYDIRSLSPLCPRYISTVDSGNLVCAMVTVRQALRLMPKEPVSPQRVLNGIAHALAADCYEKAPEDEKKTVFKRAVALTQARCKPDTRGLCVLRDRLGRLEALLGDDGAAWNLSLKQVQDAIEALDALMPWLRACPDAAKAHAEVMDKMSSMHALRFDAAKAIALLSADPSSRELCDLVFKGHMAARDRQAAAGPLCDRLTALVDRTDFAVLYDEERELMYIGMDGEGRTGRAHYDLWTSEARLTSLVAMAKGEVPFDHYRRLGRVPTRYRSHRTLLSWSGTMFEYLMTHLFVPDAPGSLGETVVRGAVKIQRAYARRLGLPFGMSESGYYAFDRQLNYQYKAFGVPSIGFKSGLVRERVIAPYASVMAATVDAHAALENMERLEKEGAASPFGFYEALDYTPERIGEGRKVQVVQSAMVHHQGMMLCALTNVLEQAALQKWFMNDPGMRSLWGLLEERSIDTWPKALNKIEELSPPTAVCALPGRVVKQVQGAHLSQLLSGGSYHVRITATGGGMSTLNGIALNRWRDDPVLDDYGLRVYIRLKGQKPFCAMPGADETLNREESVEFFPHFARFTRSKVSIGTELEVFVCPEPDAEARVLTLENTSHRALEVEVSCAFEPVLCRIEHDVAHPAFSSLFLECSADEGNRLLLCKRRSRASDQPQVCAGAWLVGDRREVEFVYCLDREQLIRGGLGRIKTKSPHPVMAWGARLTVPARSTRRVAFVVCMAPDPETVYGHFSVMKTMAAVGNAMELARAFAQAALRHIGLLGSQVNLCQRLSARLLYVKSREEKATARARDLWALGISGDVPIVLSNVYTTDQMEDIRTLFAFYRYWLFCGLDVDLVFINRSRTDYYALLGETLRDEAQRVAVPQGNRGSVHILNEEDVADPVIRQLYGVARVVLNAGESWRDFAAGQLRSPIKPYMRAKGGTLKGEGPLEFDNGAGGFDRDGTEYVIRVGESGATAVPWCNVLANPGFGTLCAAQGIAYTWAENSRQNKLTPWHNDNARFRPGETVYMLDTVNSEIESLTPLPAGAGDARVRYGFGTVRYEGAGFGIEHALSAWVDAEQPLKYAQVELNNTGAEARQFRVCYYADWVLGASRFEHGQTVFAEYDAAAGVILASNAFSGRYGVAFLCSDQDETVAACDRGAFLGAGGMQAPAGIEIMEKAPAPVSGWACGALAADVVLRPGERKRLLYVMGYGGDKDQAKQLAAGAVAEGAAERALKNVEAYWKRRLGALRVKTPDRALDIMANGFLPYQVTACRLWARTGAYQAGGAYGFRDQLQDVLALLPTRPDEVRAHILLCARHQFTEGDVQHWWHPPATGVRTRISDDLLFLPYAVSRYVEETGDKSVLYETVPYLQGPALKENQRDAYFEAGESDVSGDVFDHCARAINLALARKGEHGLPLMLGGDWNDGMNEVGAQGRGESVWLAFFLYDVLTRFARIAADRGRQAEAAAFDAAAAELRENIEAHAWDGEWYLRAFYDDGTPLGSKTGEECRIDCISQAWAAISGAASPDRAKKAMDAVFKNLLDERHGLLKLFTPPFDRGEKQAGYIRGYLPGVRENGGQYTHAAMWVCLGFVALGDGEKAHALLSMLNPVERAKTPELREKYRGEPYVVAADVYTLQGQEGRAGWTWYTGAASWMLQAVTAMLGLKKKGDQLFIKPVLPPEWDGFSISYRFGSARYDIVAECAVDAGEPDPIQLVDDAKAHAVHVRVPKSGG